MHRTIKACVTELRRRPTRAPPAPRRAASARRRAEYCEYSTRPSTRVTVAMSNLSGVSVVASHVFVSTLIASCERVGERDLVVLVLLLHQRHRRLRVGADAVRLPPAVVPARVGAVQLEAVGLVPPGVQKRHAVRAEACGGEEQRVSGGEGGARHRGEGRGGRAARRAHLRTACRAASRRTGARRAARPAAAPGTRSGSAARAAAPC